MRYIVLALFLALPALAALGHDIWLAYGKEFDYTKPIRLSNLGWLWQVYHGETYEWARENINPDSWKNLVEPLLLQKSVIVGLFPVAIYVAFKAVTWIFGLGEFQGRGLLLNRLPRKTIAREEAVARNKRAFKYSRK